MDNINSYYNLDKDDVAPDNIIDQFNISYNIIKNMLPDGQVINLHETKPDYYKFPRFFIYNWDDISEGIQSDIYHAIAGCKFADAEYDDGGLDVMLDMGKIRASQSEEYWITDKGEEIEADSYRHIMYIMDNIYELSKKYKELKKYIDCDAEYIAEGEHDIIEIMIENNWIRTTLNGNDELDIEVKNSNNLFDGRVDKIISHSNIENVVIDIRSLQTDFRFTKEEYKQYGLKDLYNQSKIRASSPDKIDIGEGITLEKRVLDEYISVINSMIKSKLNMTELEQLERKRQNLHYELFGQSGLSEENYDMFRDVTDMFLQDIFGEDILKYRKYEGFDADVSNEWKKEVEKELKQRKKIKSDNSNIYESFIKWAYKNIPKNDTFWGAFKDYTKIIKKMDRMTDNGKLEEMDEERMDLHNLLKNDIMENFNKEELKELLLGNKRSDDNDLYIILGPCIDAMAEEVLDKPIEASYSDGTLKNYFKKKAENEEYKDYKGIGIYWSYSEDTSYGYNDVSQDAIMLIGRVNESQINLRETLLLNMTESEEKEIRLKSGSSVEIIGYKYKNNKNMFNKGITVKANIWDSILDIATEDKKFLKDWIDRYNDRVYTAEQDMEELLENAQQDFELENGRRMNKKELKEWEEEYWKLLFEEKFDEYAPALETDNIEIYRFIDVKNPEQFISDLQQGKMPYVIKSSLNKFNYGDNHWIDPNGEIYNVEGKTHADWIADNEDKVKLYVNKDDLKEYLEQDGIDSEDEDIDRKMELSGDLMYDMFSTGWIRLNIGYGEIDIEMGNNKNLNVIDEILDKMKFERIMVDIKLGETYDISYDEYKDSGFSLKKAMSKVTASDNINENYILNKWKKNFEDLSKNERLSNIEYKSIAIQMGIEDICKDIGIQGVFKHSGSYGSESTYFSFYFGNEILNDMEYSMAGHTNYKTDFRDIDLRDSDIRISQNIYNILSENVKELISERFLKEYNDEYWIGDKIFNKKNAYKIYNDFFGTNIRSNNINCSRKTMSDLINKYNMKENIKFSIDDHGYYNGHRELNLNGLEELYEYLEKGDKVMASGNNKNLGEYKGEKFWIGMADIIDGHIYEVHTYEEAQENDFHHTFYFSQESINKYNEESNVIFWVKNGDIIIDWDIINENNLLKDLIKKQIKILSYDITSGKYSPGRIKLSEGITVDEVLFHKYTSIIKRMADKSLPINEIYKLDRERQDVHELLRQDSRDSYYKYGGKALGLEWEQDEDVAMPYLDKWYDEVIKYVEEVVGLDNFKEAEPHFNEEIIKGTNNLIEAGKAYWMDPNENVYELDPVEDDTHFKWVWNNKTNNDITIYFDDDADVYKWKKFEGINDEIRNAQDNMYMDGWVSFRRYDDGTWTWGYDNRDINVMKHVNDFLLEHMKDGDSVLLTDETLYTKEEIKEKGVNEILGSKKGIKSKYFIENKYTPQIQNRIEIFELVEKRKPTDNEIKDIVKKYEKEMDVMKPIKSKKIKAGEAIMYPAWWIAPDKKIYIIEKSDVTHAEWVIDHAEDIVKKYIPDIQDFLEDIYDEDEGDYEDDEIYEKMYLNGWTRVRRYGSNGIFLQVDFPEVSDLSKVENLISKENIQFDNVGLSKMGGSPISYSKNMIMEEGFNLAKIYNKYKEGGIYSAENKKEKEPNKKYGCLMVKMNDDISRIFKDFAEKNISKDKLYKSEKLSYVDGVPSTIHCTILFGMVEENIDEIKKYLYPIKMRFGKISKFPSKDESDPYDCLYVEGYSKDATEINKKLTEKFEYHNDYPDYKIHITLCYAKKGSCDNLLGKQIDELILPEKGMGYGDEWVLNEFKYSSPMGKKFEFEVNDKIESAYMSTIINDGSQEKSYSQDNYFLNNIDNLADMIYDEDFAKQIIEVLRNKGYNNITKENIYDPGLKQMVNEVVNQILMDSPSRSKSNNVADYMPEDIDLKHWMGILK
jgi:hypothetical protein